MSENEKRYLLVAPHLESIGTFESRELDGFRERHRFDIEPLAVTAPITDLERDVVRATGIDGVVFTLSAGIPPRRIMRASKRVLASARQVFYWWPEERAVEVVDRDRLRSFWKHWVLYLLAVRIARLRARVDRMTRQRALNLARRVRGLAERQITGDPNKRVEGIHRKAREARSRVQSVPFVSDGIVAGPAVYLRTDFWAPLSSGGSYGHTCYFAKALSGRCGELVCVMANRFALLDELGLRQIALAPDTETCSELDCIEANTYYYDALKPILEYIRPAFIYERLCLANFAGARLSQELGIPYFVEYNGSELSMKRSFEGTSQIKYEDFLLDAERLAFDQATVISVISERVREDLVNRGVDPVKILVSWNAVDLEAYAPVDETERAAVRHELGCADDDQVVCFTGTFGGWHGIDVLAAALPRICSASPRAKFLLIGDGVHKADVTDSVRRAGLQQRVIDCGRVEQQAAARLMVAADIFVSPHSRNMVDSPFFGSPTKLFEYMAYGKGIVASDLEQLADILHPALRVGDIAKGSVQVTDQQAILCRPGDVDEFVAAVLRLVEEPEVAVALGRNARAGVENNHTWAHRVESLWDHLGAGTDAVRKVRQVN